MGMVALASPVILSTLLPGSSAVTLNAAGESRGMVGRVRLQGGSGSKTISSAGGAVFWLTGTSTFAHAGGTTIEAGIQDPAATGVEDGTFDVSGTLVSGTDTITANTWQNTPMDTGSKTLTHGQEVVVVIEMPTRGSPDAVQVRGYAPLLSGASFMAYPYGTSDLGTLAKATIGALAYLKFDDGTYGWIDFCPPVCAAATSALSVNSGSTPDEVGGQFQVKNRCVLGGIGFLSNIIPSTADFDLVLYGTPGGTPSALATVSVDADQVSNSGGGFVLLSLSSPVTLEPNVSYAVILKPTTANALDFLYYDLGSGFDVLKAASPFSEIKMVDRTDLTGAFAETETYHVPIIVLAITSIDDGLGVAEAACQIGVI